MSTKKKPCSELPYCGFDAINGFDLLNQLVDLYLHLFENKKNQYEQKLLGHVLKKKSCENLIVSSCSSDRVIFFLKLHVLHVY